MAGFKNGKIETTHEAFGILCADSTNPGEFVTIDEGVSGQEFMSNGAATYPSMQNPGQGNDWTEIVSGSIPAASSFAITDGLGEDFDEYLIMIKNAESNGSGGFLNLNLSDNGGSSYDFDIATKGAQGSGTTGTEGTFSLTSQPLYLGGALDGDGFSPESPAHFWIYFSGNKSGNFKSFQVGSYASVSITRINWYFGMALTNSDIDAVQFALTTQDFDAGTYSIRGR